MEQILNIKRKLEQQQQMNLGQAMQKLSAAMQHLQIVQFKHQDAIKQYQELTSSGRIIPLELKSIGDGVKYYHERYLEEQEHVKALEEQVEIERDKLRDAVKERKTYEILREKAYEEYLAEEKAEEAKNVDEIVSYKYRE